MSCVSASEVFEVIEVFVMFGLTVETVVVLKPDQLDGRQKEESCIFVKESASALDAMQWVSLHSNAGDSV